MRNNKILTIALSAALSCADAHDLPDGGKSPFESRYLETPSGRLYFEKEGSGPVVVLVAGGPGSGHGNFHPLFSRLAKNHTVIYLDNLGRGKSARLADESKYSVEQDAEDIEAVRKALGAEKIALVGHSYGAIPALEYALRYPERADKAVLCSSPVSGALWQSGIDEQQGFYRSHFPEVWSEVERLRKVGDAASRGKIEALLAELPDRSWKNPEAKKARPVSKEPTDKFNAKVFEAIAGDDADFALKGSVKDYDPFKRIDALRARVLVCGGRYDFGVPPRVAAAIKARLPAARSELVIFENSGHRPWAEEGDAYIAKVAEFLDRPE